jgi:hypothetical protein
MQVYISPAAVIGSQVKNHFNAIHCRPRNARLAKIGFHERNVPIFQVVFDIV